jgi:hypothetical protein
MNERYYLMHFDCYCKATTNPVRVKTLSDVKKAEIRMRDAAPEFDPLSYVRLSKPKQLWMQFEVCHPLSTLTIARIERMLPVLEHTSLKSQVAYLSFATKNAPLFEPNMVVLPLTEFRTVMSFQMMNGNSDHPQTFEYWIDFAKVDGIPTKTPFQLVMVAFTSRRS